MAALIAARRADGIPMRGVVPGAGGLPVLVLQAQRRPAATSGAAAGTAQGRGRAPVRGCIEGKYGSPRITADLREAGWRVSENTVAALMAEQHLAARRKKKRKGTTRPGKGRWRAPDLVRRDFPATQLNTKWYGDGTEIPTGEGKLHLASVLDMASRRILGFALGEHHDAQLAYGALAMAVAVRGGQVPGVILHTDQGSEYTARTFRAACEPAGHPPVDGQARLRPGQRGHRVLALHPGVRAARPGALRYQDASAGPGRCLDRRLQRHRRHSALAMLSPVNYEKTLPAGKAA